MFTADNWLAACLTIQTLPFYFILLGVKEKKRNTMKILPTRIPDSIYSLENTISKKQNKHYYLWIIFVPSNILNTNQLYVF